MIPRSQCSTRVAINCSEILHIQTWAVENIKKINRQHVTSKNYALQRIVYRSYADDSLKIHLLICRSAAKMQMNTMSYTEFNEAGLPLKN